MSTSRLRHTLFALTLALALVPGCGVGQFEQAPTPGRDQQNVDLPGSAPRLASSSNLPGSKVQFLDYGVQKSASDPGSWGKVLTDIESHLPSSYGGQYRDSDKLTHGHETTHGINSDVRNNYNNTGKKVNGLYLLESRAALVVEPGIRKSAVAAYVPQALRGSRYSLYISGQTAWDDTPTYIMDEWVSYRNGSEVGVDLVNSGKWSYPWRDGVAGTLEFTVYGIALAMAVEKGDPSYFASNAQFKELTAWLILESMDVYRAGAKMTAFKWAKQDAYYETFKNGSAGAPVRDFIKRVYGAAFLARMFGDNSQPNPPPTDPNNPPPTDPNKPPPTDPNKPPPTDPNKPPERPTPPLDPASDSDGDGVPNNKDLCGSTPAGAPIWTAGEWLGCAGGQFRDGSDSDRDGVPNALDLCSNTLAGKPVWKHGEWAGCAAGQRRDV